MTTNIVIIGNGVAGVTCARYVRKHSQVSVTVISDETPHFFSRPALMYIYMGHMTYEQTKPYEDNFWEKNNIVLLQDQVTTLVPEKKMIQMRSGRSIHYDALVLALGSCSRQLGVPGEKLKGVQGLYSYPDLQHMETFTQGIEHATVIGGGLIGIELVEMLHSRNITVDFLVRDQRFWGSVLPPAESALLERHIRTHKGVRLKLNEEVKSFEGTHILTGVRTKSGQDLPSQFAGISVGVIPNIQLVQDTCIETSRGILVDQYLRTNVPDVYAIGDCAELRAPLAHRKAIEAVWYVGRMMGQTLAHTLLGTPTAYTPGTWFNSAKFFEIEYQTYGYVPPQLTAQDNTFYWEHPKGHQCFRIVFDKESHIVLGCNVLGIRQRHEIWDQWIQEKKRIEEIISKLKEARFDEEFGQAYEHKLAEKFASISTSDNIKK